MVRSYAYELVRVLDLGASDRLVEDAARRLIEAIEAWAREADARAREADARKDLD